MEPENALERLLEESVTDPGRRPDFYRVLPRYPLLVAGALAADGTLLPRTMQGPDGTLLPIFTSAARVEQAFPPGTPCVTLPGAELFAALPEGTRAVLNPFAPFSKDLTARELEWLAGRAGPEAEPWLVPAGEQVLLGQPAERPEALLAALRALFRRRPAVAAGFLAQVSFPGASEQPHAVIGVQLEGAGGFEALARDLGTVARAALPPGSVVDFVEVPAGSSSGIPGYLARQVPPFYRRG